MKLFKQTTKTHPVARRRLTDDVSRNTHSTQAVEADLNERYTFRRNRTLTGSLSSNVSSVSEHRAELRSPRMQHHDLRRQRRKLFGLLIGCSMIAVLLLGLVYQSIAVVKVTATSMHTNYDAAMYARGISGYFASHPFERFRFALDKQGLTRYLQENGAPEVASIDSTEFGGFGTSILHVTFRRPAVSWDYGAAEVYVDTTGATFERNYYASPSVKVVDKSGIRTEDNKVVASKRFLGFMGVVIGRMAEQGLVVTTITLPAGTTRQVDVGIESKGYPLKFSIDRPAGEQSEDAARAIRYLDSQAITPEYVDVRVSQKVYYK